MKLRMRFFASIGVLLLMMISAGRSQTVTGSTLSYTNVPLAITWPAFSAGTVSSSPFSIAGLNYFQIVAIVNGTVATCSVSVDGATAIAGSFSTGSVIPAATIGSCTSPLLYTSAIAVTPSLQGRITVTITGSGSVTFVLLGYTTNPTNSGGGGSGPTSINSQTASYTLVLTDASGYVRMNVASANTVTVPLNASVAFPIGTSITVRQAGAGQTTIVATAGVTINTPSSLALRVQNSSVQLLKVATDTWDLMGDTQ